MRRVPALIGIGGPFNGEKYPLEHLKPVIVGRSRSADISVKRTQVYRFQSVDERDKDERAQTISARHFQITFFNLQSIEIKNLSVNGTRLDSKPIQETAIVSDIARKAHEIAFGADAKFRLEMCNCDDPVTADPS
jgi:hypothetical protein